MLLQVLLHPKQRKVDLVLLPMSTRLLRMRALMGRQLMIVVVVVDMQLVWRQLCKR